MAGPEEERGRRTFTFKRTFRFGTPRPQDSEAEVIIGPAQRLEWKWDSAAEGSADGQPAQPEPATYYEALSGRPDPNRELFIRARALLNLAVTIIALAIPVVLIAAAIISRADLQTIVLLGVFGLIVGLMIKSSFPKTPFG